MNRIEAWLERRVGVCAAGLPWAILALAVAGCCVWWTGGLGYTDDDARMILEARALPVSGYPSHNNHLGMVTLLVPFASSMTAMHFVICSCMVVLAWLTYRLAEDLGGYWCGVTAGLLTATSPLLHYWGSEIMTEVPFATLAVAGLLLAVRKRFVWALVAAVAAATFRSIGVTLVVAIGVAALMECPRRYRWVFLGAIPLAWAVGRWTGHLKLGWDVLKFAGPYREAGSWASFPVKVWDNLVAYLCPTVTAAQGHFRGHAAFAVVPSYVSVWPYVGLAVLAACAWGLWELRKDRVVVLYAGLYAGALLVWPQDLSGSRYVAPLLPVLYLGIAFLLGQPGRKAALAVGCAAVLLMSGLMLNAARVATGPFIPPGYKRYFAISEKCRDLPAGSVIACRKPSATEVLSGHRAISYQFAASPDEVLAALYAQGVTHVIADQLEYSQTQQYLLPALAKHQDRFALAGFSGNPDPKVWGTQRPTMLLVLRKEP